MPPRMVVRCLLFVYCARGARGVSRVHSKLQTIHSILHRRCVCVYQYVLAGNDKYYNEGCGAWKGKGSDQGPARPSTTSSCTQYSTFPLTLDQNGSSHSSTCDQLFLQGPRHE